MLSDSDLRSVMEMFAALAVADRDNDVSTLELFRVGDSRRDAETDADRASEGVAVQTAVRVSDGMLPDGVILRDEDAEPSSDTLLYDKVRSREADLVWEIDAGLGLLERVGEGVDDGLGERLASFDVLRVKDGGDEGEALFVFSAVGIGVWVCVGTRVKVVREKSVAVGLVTTDEVTSLSGDVVLLPMVNDEVIDAVCCEVRDVL